jgi:hypothetical protein
MGVVLEALKSLAPKGRLKLHDALSGGIADAVEDLKLEGRILIDEGWPGTAIETLPQWHDTLGVAYDPTARSVAEQQIILAAMETATGGMTLALLKAQFDKEFQGRVIVSEAYIIGITGAAVCGLGRCGLASAIIYALGYNISGTVYSSIEAARVTAILARYAPAHLQPNSLLVDLSATSIAFTGLARAGIARTGKNI